MAVFVADLSLRKRGGGTSDEAVTDEGVIAMTTTGAQYALAASSGPGNGGGATAASVGVDSKASVVVVTTSSSSGTGSSAQTQSARPQQLITVVTSADPSSPNNLQPIQVSTLPSCV